MALVPATTIKLIKGIGFDSSYADVVLFSSETEQYNYFSGKSVKSYPANSYTRLSRGYISLAAKFEDVCDCSYLMFRNENHESKWWYAFIDDIEYVNENTVKVRFSIDVMQSYMFSYTLGESFVVREHPETDDVGSNIVPENLYYGEYLYEKLPKQVQVSGANCPFGIDDTITADDMCIVVAYNPAFIDFASIGVDDYLWKESLYGGVYQGVRFVCMPFTDKAGAGVVEGLVEKLDSFIGAKDFGSFGGILGIYMMPIMFLPDRGSVDLTNVTRLISFDSPTTVGEYTPHNKKLLTYPYVAINATNHRDAGADYAYEYFKDRVPTFAYEGTLSLNPSCICYPAWYKNKSFCVEEGVTIDAYPICTWGEDGITDWVSNHLFQTAIGIGTAAATCGASAYASASRDIGGALRWMNPGMTAKQVKSVMNDPNALKQIDTSAYATHKANAAMGANAVIDSIGAVTTAASSPTPPASVGRSDLLFGSHEGASISIFRKFIRPEYAKKLDDYFTRYGYATNELKVPNLVSRPYFNYIQLNNVHLNDIKCPMDVVDIIRKVYEHGVTFWRPTAQIGIYDPDVQDNSV